MGKTLQIMAPQLISRVSNGAPPSCRTMFSFCPQRFSVRPRELTKAGPW